MKHLILALIGVLAIDQPEPPALLKQALVKLPGFRTLNPSTDLAGAYTLDELKSFKLWPPWVIGDMDRDGRRDVVAVVVNSTPAGPRFGVIAIHAKTPTEVQWIVPMGERTLDGVSVGPAADTAMPLFCIECDSNLWYRWSGRSYEPELSAVGEHLVATQEGRALGYTLVLCRSTTAEACPRMASGCVC